MPRFFFPAALLAAVLVLGACQKQGDSVPKAVEQADVGGAAAPGIDTTLSKEFNVGDAETSIELIMELDPASTTDSITEEKVLTARKSLSQALVKVQGTPPAELWVRVRVRAGAPFIERTVVLRGAITRDEQPIAGFQTVLGKYALEDDPAQPKIFRVNVLDGLPEAPATMLLYAKAEVLLAPKGTDEAAVDPATLTADPGDISAKLSNPLRIEFNPVPALISAPQ